MKYILLTILFIFISSITKAHEIRPASLMIKEISTDQNQLTTYEVLWKVPANGGNVLDITPIFDTDFQLTKIKTEYLVSEFLINTYTLITNKPLHQTILSIQNLEKTITDVVVTVFYRNGDLGTVLIQPTSNQARLPAKNTLGSIIKTYTNLGVEHILLGYDHLLFVLALLLLSTGFKELLKTITAFTVAHSITLCLTVFNIINLDTAPVEAVIALSIVYLGLEINNSTKGKETITTKKPWLIAFIFGLLHGLGFAGALSEIGLPKINVAFALVAFNIGVEIGQVIFISASLFIIFLLSKSFRKSKKALKFASYAIGSIAMFWLIDRLYGILI